MRTGQPFSAYVPITNDNTDPSKQTIDSSAGGYNFSITEGPDEYQGGYAAHSTGFSLNPGDTRTAQVDFGANGNTNSIRTLRLEFYPDYYGYGSLGSGCSITFPIYQHFNIEPFAKVADGTNPENPYETDGTTHGISYIVGGDLTEGRTTTATTTAG